jgi:UDP-GlcNAc:undecaprenyl-phosphate/decaprenyl-phosphate GlcNAc-1-phosphate transferase
MDKPHLTILPFLVAMVVALTVSPLVIYFYERFGWVVDPKKSKHPAHSHTRPVPKGGGIPVLLGTLLACVIFLEFDFRLLAILAASILVVVVGTLDDIFDLNPYLRLLTNLTAALIVVGAGIGIGFITNPLTSGVIDLSGLRFNFEFLGEQRSIWILADLFALIWIPFVMNAINWSKGLDGQLPGVVTVAAIVIGLLGLRYSGDSTQWPVSILAFAVAGAYAGYLPYNFFPQRSMPGYGGGSFAGFMLATLAILSTTKVGTALLVLGIPFMDAMFSITRRLLQGKSPVWGDRGHLHHKLMDLGWSKRKISVFYWTVTMLLGMVALKLNSQQKLYTMLAIALALGGFFLWIYFGRYSRQSDLDSGSRT